MVSAVAPKDDLNPFGENEASPERKLEEVEIEIKVQPEIKVKQENIEVEESTAASTMAVGEYSNVRQTSTNTGMEIIEEDADAEDVVSDILSFIELKYCTVCHLEMQIRTKHCK